MTLGDVLTVLSLAVGIGTPFTVGLVLLLRGAGKRVAWILLAGALSIVVVFGAHVIGTPWALVVGVRVARAVPVAAGARLRLSRTAGCRRRAGGRSRGRGGVAASASLLLLPLQPTLEGADGDVASPLPIGSGAEDLLTPMFWVCWFGLLVSLFAGALALRARYKAGGDQLRRQVLWLAYGALLLAALARRHVAARRCSGLDRRARRRRC